MVRAPRSFSKSAAAMLLPPVASIGSMRITQLWRGPPGNSHSRLSALRFLVAVETEMRDLRVGMISISPSIMPSPARRIGARTISWASATPSVSVRGVLTGIFLVASSSVAATVIIRPIKRRCWRKVDRSVCADRRIEWLLATKGCLLRWMVGMAETQAGWGKTSCVVEHGRKSRWDLPHRLHAAGGGGHSGKP